MQRAAIGLVHSLVLVLAIADNSVGQSQLDPSLAISQYAHTAWRMEQGVFDGAPNAITQTPNGYLWIGTDAGVVRFDGVQFLKWTAPTEAPALSSPVYTLLGTRDGALWIGTGSGIVRWDGAATLQQFPDLTGRFNSILEDRNGAVWALRSRFGANAPAPGPLCYLTSTSARCFGSSDGIACLNGVAATRDRHGDLWFGGSNALCRWNPFTAEVYLQKELQTTAGGLPGISAAASASDGSIWVGIARSGIGLGLVRVRDEKVLKNVVPDLDASRVTVSALLVDRDDSVWLGTEGDGLYRIRGQRLEHFGEAEGLSGGTIQAFYQDREGSIWVVGSRGLDRFRPFHVVSYGLRQGLASDTVTSVLATSDGTIWISTSGRLDRIRAGTVSSLSDREGLPGKNTTALFEDREHRLWMGVDDGLAIYEKDSFRPVPSDTRDPLGIVTTITQDADGSIWARTAGRRAGLLHIVNGKILRRIPSTQFRTTDLAADPKSGLWVALGTGGLGHFRDDKLETFDLGGSDMKRLQGLHVNVDGSVWVASSEGIFHWKDGIAKRLDRRNGLPCDNIFTLVPDGSGSLWLSARCGVIELPAAEISRWLKQPDVVVSPRVFNAFDGALPAMATFSPRASVSPDGRIWFATDSVLQMIDPARANTQVMPVNILIEQVTADRRRYAATDGVRLPARTRDIQLDYTAMTLAVPERVRFRYRLDGKDLDWQEAGSRRQALYNDLGPGSYRFHVAASNADGAWNEKSASLKFTVAPAYYQMAWFRASAIGLLAGLLWVSYLLHMRRVAAGIVDRMEAQLAERERIARELHDTVLQGANGLILSFQAVSERIPFTDPTRSAIEDTLVRAERVVAEGRMRVVGLRTKSEDGSDLRAALEAAGKDVSTSDVDVRVVLEGDLRALNTIVRDEVYWIAREAMANALRSADARSVEVNLSFRHAELSVSIRDDGHGVEPAVLEAGGRPGHFGIRGMNERAQRIGAAFRISTAKGVGTEVCLKIPAAVAYRQLSMASRRWSHRWTAKRLRRSKRLE